jgi:hypothetical protein
VNTVCVDPSMVVPFPVTIGSGVRGAIEYQPPTALNPGSLSGMLKTIVLPGPASASRISWRREPGPLSLVVETTSTELARTAAGKERTQATTAAAAPSRPTR